MKKEKYSVSFTDGTLWRQLVRFAVPLALTSIIQQLFHSADTAVLGHYVGADAMAAVGCGGSLVNPPLFLTDAAIIEIAMKRMRYTVLFKFVNAAMDITNGCLQGFGYTLVPALLSIFGVCGVHLLWIYTVFPAHHTLDGLMAVYPLTQSFAAVVQSVLCFRYLKKREKGTEAR